MKANILGLAWFASKSDYDAIRSIAGKKDMPSTYEEWVPLAERAEKRFQSQGLRVVRAIIKKDEFIAFCAARGLDVNSEGRVAFGNYFAAHYEDMKN